MLGLQRDTTTNEVCRNGDNCYFHNSLSGNCSSHVSRHQYTCPSAAPVIYQDTSTRFPQGLQSCIKTPVHMSFRSSSHVSRHQYTCPSAAPVMYQDTSTRLPQGLQSCIKTPVHVSLCGCSCQDTSTRVPQRLQIQVYIHLYLLFVTLRLS